MAGTVAIGVGCILIDGKGVKFSIVVSSRYSEAVEPISHFEPFVEDLRTHYLILVCKGPILLMVESVVEYG